MFVALPAPTPDVLVGVLTAMKIMSAREMLSGVLEVKKRLGSRLEVAVSSVQVASDVWFDSLNNSLDVPSRASRTILCNPGSWMGRWADSQRAIRRSSRSRTSTLIEGLCRAITAAVGPPLMVSRRAQRRDLSIAPTHIASPDDTDPSDSG